MPQGSIVRAGAITLAVGAALAVPAGKPDKPAG